VLIAHRNMRDAMVKGNQPGPPAVTYDRELTIFLGGAEVRALYFAPGHTDGDTVVYFADARVVQAGDLVLWGKRVDGSTLVPAINYPTGANLTKLIANLDGILALEFDSLIPGHGPVLTRPTVQTYRQNLITLKQRVKEAVSAGVKKDDLPGRIKPEDLGWPLAPALLASMYDEVAAER